MTTEDRLLEAARGMPGYIMARAASRILTPGIDYHGCNKRHTIHAALTHIGEHQERVGWFIAWCTNMRRLVAGGSTWKDADLAIQIQNDRARLARNKGNEQQIRMFVGRLVDAARDADSRGQALGLVRTILEAAQIRL